MATDSQKLAFLFFQNEDDFRLGKKRRKENLKRKDQFRAKEISWRLRLLPSFCIGIPPTWSQPLLVFLYGHQVLA
jgi:hypothetical protein